MVRKNCYQQYDDGVLNIAERNTQQSTKRRYRGTKGVDRFYKKGCQPFKACNRIPVVCFEYVLSMIRVG
jgi:hypothetical protein